MRSRVRVPDVLFICIILGLIFLLVACASVPIYDSEFIADKGSHGAIAFRTLTDGERRLTKAEWDAERFGMVCTTADTFSNWKSSLEKLCALTKRCVYKKQADKFFSKVERNAGR